MTALVDKIIDYRINVLGNANEDDEYADETLHDLMYPVFELFSSELLTPSVKKHLLTLSVPELQEYYNLGRSIRMSNAKTFRKIIYQAHRKKLPFEELQALISEEMQKQVEKNGKGAGGNSERKAMRHSCRQSKHHTEKSDCNLVQKQMHALIRVSFEKILHNYPFLNTMIKFKCQASIRAIILHKCVLFYITV